MGLGELGEILWHDGGFYAGFQGLVTTEGPLDGSADFKRDLFLNCQHDVAR